VKPVSRTLIPVFALAVMPLVCAAAQEIALPADPPASRTVTPQVLWSIGGEDEEDVLLGLVSGTVQGPDGNTYLLDTQLSQVLVISPEGELVATLGREGDGPGEMRRPHNLFFLDDHTLAVIQGFPSNLTLLNLDGTPAGRISLGCEASEGGFKIVQKALPADGRLVVAHGRGTFDPAAGKSTMKLSLAVFDREGNEQVQLITLTQERDMTRMVFDEAKEFSELDQWGVSSQGLIFTTPEREDYVISVYDLTGAKVRTMRRPFTTRTRTDEDKKRIGSGRVFRRRGLQIEVENHILDTDPAIMGLNTAADGRLFVTDSFGHGKGLPEGIAARYGVISSEGEFIEELSLAIPDFDADQDRVNFLDGKHFLVLHNIRSATEAFRAGFGGSEAESDDEDLGDVEPLELVLYTLP